MPKKIITIEQEKLVKDLYIKGKMGKEISQISGLTLKQIYSSLKRQKIPRKSLSEQNKILFERKQPSFDFKETLSIKDRELMIGAIMLYYGEGAKTGVTVDLANSDILVIKLFLKFLRKVCRIKEEKLRFYLYCFEDQNVSDLINYWSFQLNAGIAQFTKPYVRPTVNRGSRSMPHGVMHIRYGDKKLLEKILYLCKDLARSL